MFTLKNKYTQANISYTSNINETQGPQINGIYFWFYLWEIILIVLNNFMNMHTYPWQISTEANDVLF